MQFYMPSKMPRIGISVSEMLENKDRKKPTWKPFDYLKREYHEAVQKSGGVPILLPNINDPSLAHQLIDMIDGLLLTGGGDIHPSYYGQAPHPTLTERTLNRDSFEMSIARLALERDMPVFSICRGHQVLNVALGGTLHQDLSCIKSDTVIHADPEQTARIYHKIKIARGTKLHEIIGSDIIETNSSHHQVIDKPGSGLKFSAFAFDDNIPEAIEHTELKFVIGVQWHPEAVFDREHSRRIFSAFIEASARK